MHRLLKRQLTRHLGSTDVPDTLRPLLEAVEEAYAQHDDDLEMLERSLEISSAELMQKNSEMRAVFQAFPDCFFWIDGQGRVLDYRQGSRSHCRQPASKIIGRHITEAPVCACGELFDEAIAKAAAVSEGHDIEYGLSMNGDQYYYEARLLPLFHDRLIVMVRDITDRKHDEEMLRRGHDELEQRVGERTAELLRANQELKEEIGRRVHVERLLREAKTAAEEANKTKTNFLSTVSHELRTPLTSVVGFAKMIGKQLSEHIFPLVPFSDSHATRAMKKVEGNIGIIVAEGERLTVLINDVLDISRLEAGKMDFTMEPVAVLPLVRHAAEATRALFEARGLDYSQEVSRKLPPVLGDRDRIIQVLINLFSNAVKFTDAGSVTCRAALEDDSVRISVTDTGCGLRPEDTSRIFDKFQQLGDTLTDRPRGTGLGLAICRQIVDQHGGSIDVESAPGKGSTFSFTLPLAAPTGS